MTELKDNDEIEKTIKSYFYNNNQQLKVFPKKQKVQIIILDYILKKFDLNKKYTEKEVNEILKPIYEDYALLRRSLIDYKFLDRYDDCSYYWVKQIKP